MHPACAPLFRGPGWDWAPYTHTFLDGAHTFSKGVWKDVYLVASAPAAAAITYVVPQIFYQARLPSSFYASAYATAQHVRAHKGVAR